MKTEKYNVTGMTCAACQANVTKCVTKLAGVEEVNVSLLANQMTVYNMSGYEVFETALDISYNDIELMRNNEIVISNGKDVNIYTMQGIKKFAYSFETSIYKIIPGRGSRRYIFLEQDVTELVTLT